MHVTQNMTNWERTVFVLISLSLIILVKSLGNVEGLTIRVNTFRRLDLIKNFMEYYETCAIVKQVQIIWSDQANTPPLEWLKIYKEGKYVFEVHNTDSLSNRFRVREIIQTEAVLSIDDDLIVPCLDLGNAYKVWSSNRRTLVGFSPRLHSFDIFTGNLKYLTWQRTWWNGMYSIMLTKAAILHKDYLAEFDKTLPTAMVKHIDDHRNCEDLAMAYIVATLSRAAPVWVQVTIFETSVSGISSGLHHFIARSECLQMLQDLPASVDKNADNKATTSLFPWVIGYQKSVAISYMDWIRYWWFDVK